MLDVIEKLLSAVKLQVAHPICVVFHKSMVLLSATIARMRCELLEDLLINCCASPKLTRQAGVLWFSYLKKAVDCKHSKIHAWGQAGKGGLRFKCLTCMCLS